MSKTILIFESVTGGGLVGQPLPPSLSAEGSAIRRAIVADFAAVAGVRVVEPVDARCLGPEPTPAHVTRIIVDPAHPIDLGAVAAGGDGVILIAPETDRILLALTEEMGRGGIRSLGSTPEAIALCADKLALAGHFERVGVPTPPTLALTPGSDWPEDWAGSGRVVVKPTDGAGAVATFVLPGSAPRPAWLRDRAGLIVQPFRPGEALSASFLVGPDGRAWLIAVGRQAIGIDPEGRVEYQGGTVPIALGEADLAPVRRAVESVRGLAGFVGVDFVRSEPAGIVEILEINPRLTTSIVALVRLARPGTIARAWLDLALGGRNPDDDPQFRAIRAATPVRFRADGSFDLNPRSDA